MNKGLAFLLSMAIMMPSVSFASSYEQLASKLTGLQPNEFEIVGEYGKPSTSYRANCDYEDLAGVDILVQTKNPYDTEIKAPFSGKVVNLYVADMDDWSDEQNYQKTHVGIKKTGSNQVAFFIDLYEIQVKQGQTVSAGTVIGSVARGTDFGFQINNKGLTKPQCSSKNTVAPYKLL